MGSHKTKTVALLAVAAAMIWGCESSDVLAPSDSQIVVEANPATVVIDKEADEEQAQSTITVRLFDATGLFPLQGIAVSFSTTGGTLASANPCGARGTCAIGGGACSSDADCPPLSVETDANGQAEDVLTLTLADPTSVDVTVSSSTVTASVTVEKTVVEGNIQPTADIVAFPADQQAVDAQVTFDGSGSDDPDGSGITCYQWRITSSFDPDSNEVIQNTSVGVLEPRSYADEQRLTVTLRVSDREDAADFCESSIGNPDFVAADPSFFSDDIASLPYEIVCDLSDPEADGGVSPRNVPNDGVTTVELAGTGTDFDSGIVRYEWDCGNNQAPVAVNTENQSIVTVAPAVECTYGTAVQTYTARLTVTNGCGQTGTDDVQIRVFNPNAL